MGKRKKAAKRPASNRQKVPLGVFCNSAFRVVANVPSDTAFTCLFCHHDKSVTVRLDRKEGVAQLVCKVCDQRYQSKVNRELPSGRVHAPGSLVSHFPGYRPHRSHRYLFRVD